MRLLKWYWFHCKRAVDLHEGRENWLKERSSLKDVFKRLGSFAVVSLGIKFVVFSLTFLIIGVYYLLILCGMKP